jgi:Ca2+/H+ antiporter
LAVVNFSRGEIRRSLDNSIEQFHMPQAFGGAIIAALVLSPEGLGGITASLTTNCNVR